MGSIPSLRIVMSGLLSFSLVAADPLGPQQLGRVWTVNEDGWLGTWTRRGDSREFDAHWRHPDGREVRDVLRLERRDGDTVVIFREGMNGRYSGRLEPGGHRIVNGSASWFTSAQRWSAELRGAGRDELGPEALGRVWSVNEDGWIGTWTRRGDSREFDAHWRHPDGREVRDVLRLEKRDGDSVVIFREGMNGRYSGRLEPGGHRIVNGSASWFSASQRWSAVLR
jgi:hypothetical protein